MEEPATGPEEGVISYSLPILGIIYEAQNLHGLKHHEYSRYRQYCSRRLRRIYKKTDFLHGRGKYQKKTLAIDSISDQRQVCIPLVSAERAWAHAMDLKNESEGMPDAAVPLRAHLRRRLSKAAAHARALSDLAQERCDSQTALEARAYSDLMGGRALVESGRWAEAARLLRGARAVLLRLAEIGASAQQTACRALLEEVEPALRYCVHKAGPGVAGEEVEDEDLLARLAALHVCEKKIDQLATGESLPAKEEPVSVTSTFRWRRMEVAVADSRTAKALGAALHAEQAATAAVSGQKEDAAGGDFVYDSERRISALDHAASAFSEVRNAIAAALALGREESDSLRELDLAIRGRTLELTLERGEAVAASASAARQRGQLRRLAQRTGGSYTGIARPEEAVRAYDALLSAAQQLHDLATEIGGALGEGIMDDAAAKMAEYQAGRCAAMAHVALGSGRWQQANSLFARAGELAADANKRHQECERVDELAIKRLDELVVSTRAFRAVAAAEDALEAAQREKEASEGVERMSIDGEGQGGYNTREPASYLAEDWDAERSFVGDSKGSIRIARLPPVPKALPVPPIVLDTALSYIETPSIKHRLSKTSAGTGGMVSRLFGWGGSS